MGILYNKTYNVTVYIEEVIEDGLGNTTYDHIAAAESGFQINILEMARDVGFLEHAVSHHLKSRSEAIRLHVQGEVAQYILKSMYK
jgi:hypothetical protein